MTKLLASLAKILAACRIRIASFIATHLRERPLSYKLALSFIGVLLALLIVPNLIWVAHHPGDWVPALVLPLASLAILFALLGRVPWLACLLLVPFAMAAPAEIYYVARYFHPSTAQIIATIAAVKPYEAQQYFGWSKLIPLVIALLFGLGVSVAAIVFSIRARLRWRGRVRNGVLIAGILALVVPFCWGFAHSKAAMNATVAVLHQYGQRYEKSYPFGVIQRIEQYRAEWAQIHAQAAHLKNFSFHAQRVGPPLGKRQIYVLVIGESSRRANWQLFGYDRATNPRLAKLDNLVRLTHFTTTWPVTIAAVPMIITRRKPLMPWDAPAREASVLVAMQEAGYETYWISNQEAIGEFASPVSIYSTEADHTEWLNHATWKHPGGYDDVLIPPLKHAIAASNKDLFIVLHMMGSHLKYSNRYPKKFAHWLPGEASPPGKGTYIERTRNSYDNSILYTDHVLNKVIQILKKSGAVTALWFESDHGEILPTKTCNRNGHGVGTVWGDKIPAFFWYSDPYKKLFPHRVENIQANANKRAMSAETFASLIDMAGVTFPTQHESWSLFSKQWHYHTRWVAWSRYVDFDHAHFKPPCGVVEPNSPSAVRPFR